MFVRLSDHHNYLSDLGRLIISDWSADVNPQSGIGMSFQVSCRQTKSISFVFCIHELLMLVSEPTHQTIQLVSMVSLPVMPKMGRYTDQIGYEATKTCIKAELLNIIYCFPLAISLS